MYLQQREDLKEERERIRAGCPRYLFGNEPQTYPFPHCDYPYFIQHTPAIARTCRQIRSEVLPIYLSSSVIVVSSYRAAEDLDEEHVGVKFLKALEKNNRRFMEFCFLEVKESRLSFPTMKVERMLKRVLEDEVYIGLPGKLCPDGSALVPEGVLGWEKVCRGAVYQVKFGQRRGSQGAVVTADTLTIDGQYPSGLSNTLAIINLHCLP